MDESFTIILLTRIKKINRVNLHFMPNLNGVKVTFIISSVMNGF